jgi:DNA-binding CsgD family transcriptional regulator
MKKDFIIRWIMLGLYILTLFWIVDFQIKQLFHLKSFVAVVFGSIFLSVSKYKKGILFDEFLDICKWHFIITGFLVTFLINITQSGFSNSGENPIFIIALSFRPLFYSMIFYLLFIQISSVKFKNADENLDANVDNPVKILSNDYISDELLLKLKIEYNLTKRESEIVDMLLLEINNSEISEKMIITESTVKKHISNIYKKCSISNRDQLRILISNL